jgi:hypothetical protein
MTVVSIYASPCWLGKNLVMVKRLNQQGKRRLVGNYYVKFDKAYKEEITHLMSTGKTEEEAKKQSADHY